MILSVDAGMHLITACRAAAVAAIQNECDIEFVHNEKRFLVVYEELMEYLFTRAKEI